MRVCVCAQERERTYVRFVCFFCDVCFFLRRMPIQRAFSRLKQCTSGYVTDMVSAPTSTQTQTRTPTYTIILCISHDYTIDPSTRKEPFIDPNFFLKHEHSFTLVCTPTFTSSILSFCHAGLRLHFPFASCVYLSH